MIEKRPMKAWNGGSIERAMELAGERRKKLVAQGALICCACDGQGGDIAGKTICEGCFGAGVILPPGGLQLPTTQARAEAAFEASQDEEIARIMALTKEELDAELRAQGLDPAEEAAKVKAIAMDAIARHHAKSK